jgi:hypothetical protein
VAYLLENESSVTASKCVAVRGLVPATWYRYRYWTGITGIKKLYIGIPFLLIEIPDFYHGKVVTYRN